MKISLQICLMLALATSALPICAARADAKLSAQQRGQIWTLTQDIISVGIENDFQNGNISNRELVRFGIYQVALRQLNLFQDDNLKGITRVPANIVAAAAMRYFGKIIEHQSVGDWKYHDGFYKGYSELFEQLDLEKIKGFRVEGSNSSQFTVYVNYEDPMASADADRVIIARAKLIFKSVLFQGKRRYILNSFVHLTPKS